MPDKSGYVIEPVGLIQSCFTEKFGIPRQAGLVDGARAQLELLAPYNRFEMVRELSQFSHLWIIFLFHETLDEGWKAAVRPPGLGGKKKVGVFASRSPHRPNHIGMSAVKLIQIEQIDDRVILELGGGDFLDGTPVVDIKPYAPFSDSIEQAKGGYSGMVNTDLVVHFSREAEMFCNEYTTKTNRNLMELIRQVLLQDPRPASQRGKKKEFGFCLWDINIRWTVTEESFFVVECQKK